jgi:hypothetical protein
MRLAWEGHTVTLYTCPECGSKLPVSRDRSPTLPPDKQPRDKID